MNNNPSDLNNFMAPTENPDPEDVPQIDNANDNIENSNMFEVPP